MKSQKIFFAFFTIFSLLLFSNLYSTQSYQLKVPDYRIDSTTGDFQRIFIDGYYSYAVPGYPDLPAKIFRVAVPPEVDPASINLNYTIEKIKNLGTYNIQESPPLKTWADDEFTLGQTADIYDQDAFFPADCIEYLGFSQMRKWRIVAFKFIPFQYNPVTGELKFVSEVKVTIDYQTGMRTDEIEFELTDSVMDSRAQQLLLNYQESFPWYQTDNEIFRATTDYVIITTNAIESSSTQLNNFLTYLTGKGYSPVVITEDEYGGLTGQAPNGTAEKTRKWLQDNYVANGINYVLLIGNPDPDDPSLGGDPVGDVPMKMCWPRRTQSTYKESPTDYFFADLTGNWDLDGDQYYGEYGDDQGVGGIDFSNEVYVGRIPVYSGVTNLDSVLTKIMSYGNSADTSWRQSILFPMSFSDATCDGAYLSEAMKSDYLTAASYSDWTLYMQGGLCAAANSTFSSDQELLTGVTKTRWMAHDYGMVWWWGHGGQTSASLGYSGCGWGTILSSSDTSSLDDSHPSFVYQCSCLNGYPENTNNLGTSLLYNGAITTVSASRVSWYAGGTSWGTWLKYYCDNASIGYYYGYELVSSQKDAGTALYDVKDDMGANNNGFWAGASLMNLYDFNLYGDPASTLQASVTAPEINLKFKNKNLPHGSSMDLGNKPLSIILGIEYTFTIENLGNQTLTLTGSPDMVTLSGPQASYFMVTQQPLTGSIAPAGSTTFKIRTKKTTSLLRWQKDVEFTINIPNNDSDENPYTFTFIFTVVN
jgi:hypothetical protein